MADWITLQETADKIGVRKGTLCMWRTRNRFPFQTKGEGRNLVRFSFCKTLQTLEDAAVRLMKLGGNTGKGRTE